MRIKRTVLALICSSVLVIAGCSSTDSDAPKDNDSAGSSESTDGADDAGEPEMPEADVDSVPDVVASVNDTDISRDAFLLDYEVQFQQAAMMSQGAEVDQDALKLDVADMMINRELIIQAAAADGIEADDEKVDEMLEDAAAQSGLSSIDEFLELAAEQGIDADQMRVDAGNQYLINTYIDNNVSVPDTPEEDLRAQYDEVVEMLKEQGADEEQIPKFEDVRDELNDEAKSNEMTAAVDAHLKQLREAANVEIFL